MAKSRNGGTRSLIRGRVGAEVYALGKDGKGNRQQIVRAIAEQVANPRTTAQMANRMIMSTVMQAVDKLSKIIDHSFDGFAAGQPCVSEFIRLNYNMLASRDKQYNAYQEKGIKLNPYIIARGNAKLPVGLYSGQNRNDDSTVYGKYGIWLSLGYDGNTTPLTIGDLQAVLIHNGQPDVFTTIDIDDDYMTQSSLKLGLDPATVLAENSVEALFNTTQKGGISALQVWTQLDANDKIVWLEIGFGTQANRLGYGYIYSRNYNGTWKHTNAVIDVPSEGQVNNYDTALATYPVGTEKFLNGGDL